MEIYKWATKGGTTSQDSQVKVDYNSMVRARNLERRDVHDQLRIQIANAYLNGDGIEIGALHKPLNIPEDKARVKYIDRLDVKGLQFQYPEIGEPMVEVHIVDDGERLSKVKSRSQNFIIANHFYEHCSNPLQTLQNLLRVLKPGGGILFAIPDKRFTFDSERSITPFQHITKDYEKGPAHTKMKHFNEWVTVVEGVKDKKEIKARLNHLLEMDYSIHYHVWDFYSLIDHFTHAKDYLKNDFELELIDRNFTENIVYLTKPA